MRDFNQTAYEAWIYQQTEPEEKLFLGRKPPREPKSWMLKPSPREYDEQKIREMEDDFLRLKGIE